MEKETETERLEKRLRIELRKQYPGMDIGAYFGTFSYGGHVLTEVVYLSAVPKSNLHKYKIINSYIPKDSFEKVILSTHEESFVKKLHLDEGVETLKNIFIEFRDNMYKGKYEIDLKDDRFKGKKDKD